MKKVLVTTVVLFGLFSMAMGQIEEKMTGEGVVKGSIFKDGKEIEGYIKAMGKVYGSDHQAYPAPWHFQGDIKFIPKDEFENTPKITGKMYKKYGPKDIGGYRYEDMYFEAVKYADMSAVGLNMIPKWMFLRKIISGKISVFYHYSSPPTVTVGESFESYYEECTREKIVCRKGEDGKMKLMGSINSLNIEKDFEDCPYVTEKITNKEYSGTLLERHLKAIEDYNQYCE